MSARDAHYPALDGLRGIAILAVLDHNLQLLQVAPHSRIGQLVEWGLDRGWIGVTLFFALSGFLITGILLDSQKAPNYFRSFFARRALRIFPLYFLALALLFIVLPALGLVPAALQPTPAQQLPFWLYVSNWTQPFGFGGGTAAHFWSLAVEEQFYLLWPFLLWRRSAKSTVVLCLAIAVVSLLCRLAMLEHHVDAEAIYMFSVCRMDALALGGAMAAALRVPGWGDRLRARAGTLLAVGVLMLVAGAVATHGYPRTMPSDQSMGYTLLAVALSLVVGGAAMQDMRGDAGRATPLRWRALRVLGKYSYCIYVIHRPVSILLGTRFVSPWLPHAEESLASTLVYLAVMLLACLALAALSYRFIEQPFLKLKRHFRADVPPPARPASEAVATGA